MAMSDIPNIERISGCRTSKDMLPYFVLDQISVGPVKVYIWGLFVGLGFSAGYLLLLYLVYPARDSVSGGARQKNLAPAKIVGLALAIFLGGILGAKVLAMALLPGGLFKNINLILSQRSGAMFMGGFVGAILFGWLYVRWAKWPSFATSFVKTTEVKKALEGKNFWAIADLLVLPTALGIGIGRIGCILINDHQGAITNLPWAILWPDGALRHPVGIYESLVGFGLFGIFWFLFSSSPQMRGGLRWGADLTNTTSPGPSSTEEGRLNGRVFLLFLLSYSAIRFFLDFTRVASGPLADPRWGILSVSQWLALLLLTFVLVLFISGKTAKLTRI